MGNETREGLDAGWQRAFAWIERELGGRIARFELQPLAPRDVPTRARWRAPAVYPWRPRA
jgi:hypothetical protein